MLTISQFRKLFKRNNKVRFSFVIGPSGLVGSFFTLLTIFFVIRSSAFHNHLPHPSCQPIPHA